MRMRFQVLLVCVAVVFCSARCALPWGSRNRRQVSIVTYNAHNFFDDVDSGREYPEFTLGSGTWSPELYRRRLENLAAAINSVCPEDGFGPDILCLQEIESEKVLRDLALGPLKKSGYCSVALGGPAESSIHCGLLSRFPLMELHAHRTLRDRSGELGRDIVEARFDLGSRSDGAKSPSAEDSLAVFICHWKSRKEGAAETEAARLAEASLLVDRVRILTEGKACHVLVCGDFNESPDEFARVKGKYRTAILECEGGCDSTPHLLGTEAHSQLLTASSAEICAAAGGAIFYSPWKSFGGYSYTFKGEKERLDGFFLGATLVDGHGWEFASFKVSEDPALMDKAGNPLAWKGRDGYSDHLPAALFLTMKD